jgi:NADH-quinone oxidoreductase subunit E
MTEKIAEKVKLSKELLEFIEKWKDQKGNLIMILHRVQKEYGFVPRDVAIKLTELLDVPLAKIYGVITFYHFFKLKKPGENIISVCMGTACYLKGGEDIIKELEKLLGIGINCITDDDKFSLEAVRCLGCCGLAPVMTINEELFGTVTKEKLPEIIAKYRGEKND